MKTVTICCLLLMASATQAQLYIQKQAQLYLQPNSSLHVEGDVFSRDNISGEGIFILSGDSIQSIDMGQYSIASLAVENKRGLKLTGQMRVEHLLSLSGPITLGSFNLSLADHSSIETNADGSLITSGSGVIRKYVSGEAKGLVIPLANEYHKTPIIISGKADRGDGFVEISSVARPSSNKPLDADEYLGHYWKVNSIGLDGNLKVQAILPQDNLGEMSAYVWDNGKWREGATAANGKIDVFLKQGTSEVYAMSLKKISIFPNPAMNQTTLRYTSVSSGTALVIVSDARGTVVKSLPVMIMPGSNSIAVPLGNLAQGSYDIALVHGSKKTTLKLVKQ